MAGLRNRSRRMKQRRRTRKDSDGVIFSVT